MCEWLNLVARFQLLQEHLVQRRNKREGQIQHSEGEDECWPVVERWRGVGVEQEVEWRASPQGSGEVVQEWLQRWVILLVS